MIVGWLGLLFSWNATYHFSFKLTYTISRTQQLFQEWSQVTKYVKSPMYQVPTIYQYSGVGTNFGLGGPRCIGRGGVRVI